MSWNLSWGRTWGGSWGLTRPEEFARSGYWRLFYYKLQEKELETRKNPATPVKPIIAVDISGKAKSKPKAIKIQAKQPEPVKKLLLRPVVQDYGYLDHARNTVWLYSYLADLYFTFSPKYGTISRPVVEKKPLDKAALLLLLASEV